MTPAQNDSPAAPVAPDAPLRRLLLLLDGSEAGEAARDFALRLAAQTGCELQAVYVVDTVTMDYLLQMHIFVGEERQEMERDLEEKGRSYLLRAKALAQDAGVAMQGSILRGRLHQVVLQYASSRGHDAIAIGGWRRTSHDRDAASAERELILQLSTVPVFVIPG